MESASGSVCGGKEQQEQLNSQGSLRAGQSVRKLTLGIISPSEGPRLAAVGEMVRWWEKEARAKGGSLGWGNR